MLSESIHQLQRIHDGVDPIEAHADRFFAETPKVVYRKERENLTKTSGTFVPLKWAERWDPLTAMYLSHFVHYLGTQKSEDGYVWDSEKEVHKKTRITPNQQRRCRRILAADQAIHMKKRGIGNKWNIRPNLPLLTLFDDMPSWDETVEKVMAEMEHDPQPEKVGVGVEPLCEKRKSEAELNCSENHEPLREYHEPLRDFRKTHNSNSTETLSNSLSGAHARPEPEERREEEKEVIPEKINRSVAILSTIESMNADARMLNRLVSTLAQKHPRADPTEVCKSYRDYVAGLPDPVRSHQRLLGTFFEKEAERVENEPRHPQADTPVFKASDELVHPKPEIDFKELARLMAQGVPDEEAVRRATVGDEERTVA
jgi:hypothetical protein